MTTHLPRDWWWMKVAAGAGGKQSFQVWRFDIVSREVIGLQHEFVAFIDSCWSHCPVCRWSLQRSSVQSIYNTGMALCLMQVFTWFRQNWHAAGIPCFLLNILATSRALKNTPIHVVTPAINSFCSDAISTQHIDNDYHITPAISVIGISSCSVYVLQQRTPWHQIDGKIGQLLGLKTSPRLTTISARSHSIAAH